MISKVYNFLLTRPLLNVIIAIIYFFLVVLPHETVGLIISKIFKNSSKAQYNQTVLMIAIAGLVVYVILLLMGLRKNKSKSIVLGYLFLSVSLVVLMLNTILVLNIELIHLVQYGIYALILFPLFQNYFHTLWCCTFLGGLDEAFQYYYLAPDRTNFLDFNDIILNLVGATFGLILIRSVPLFNEIKKRARNLRFSIATLLLTVLSLGFLSYKDLLMSEVPATFWITLPSKVTYHVVQPLEAIVILSILLLIYSQMNRKTNTTQIS